MNYFLSNLRSNEIFKFLVAGVSSNILNYLAYISALFIFGIDPLVASAIGFFCGLVTGFLINRDFTFGLGSRQDQEHLFIKYVLVQLVSLLIYIFVIYVCNSLAIISLELMVFPAIFVCACFNFLCSKFLVFR